MDNDTTTLPEAMKIWVNDLIWSWVNAQLAKKQAKQKDPIHYACTVVPIPPGDPRRNLPPEEVLHKMGHDDIIAKLKVVWGHEAGMEKRASGQLSLLGIPSDRNLLFRRLGLDPNIYQSKIDPKKGLPGQSENTLIAFFPKLGVGIDLPSGDTLRIERRNLPPNIYDIDFHILKGKEAIAYIDNEQRDAFPFDNPTVPINIPLNSFRANIEQWQHKRLSTKVKYYRARPSRCFHMARSPDMNSAICCWAKDFVSLKPVPWRTFMGRIRVWQVPREKTCFGRINQPTIEDWILLKLEQEGLLQ